jgi:NADPH:quinone reductase-like Zn-dependent oxidoreductase
MIEAIEFTTFEVQKDQWTNTRIKTEKFDGNLDQDQVLLKVDRFALTSNNISYCLAGDTLGYWKFFPTTDGFGRVPAMGYSDIVASKHPDIKTGDRYWGFYPMSNYLIVQAGKVSKSGFSDISSHRAGLAPIYAQFNKTSANPFYNEEREDHDLLLRGLFLTSWLVEDFMFDNDFFGANSYVITCASSKTSIALAHVVKERGLQKTIGMTSKGNVEFCESLGCYDQIITYDEAQTLDASNPIIIVDMAGNFSAMKALHEHFQGNVKYSCKVGATHLADLMGDMNTLPGATPTFFFAPTQSEKRNQEWGSGEVAKRIGLSLQSFQRYSDQWMNISRGNGADIIESTFQKVVSGNIKPSDGLILSM